MWIVAQALLLALVGTANGWVDGTRAAAWDTVPYFVHCANNSGGVSEPLLALMAGAAIRKDHVLALQLVGGVSMLAALLLLVGTGAFGLDAVISTNASVSTEFGVDYFTAGYMFDGWVTQLGAFTTYGALYLNIWLDRA